MVSGVITYLSDDCVLIDGMLFFDNTFCSITLNLNDKVLYLGYKDKNDSIVVVRILENQGLAWCEKEEVHESSYKVIEHVIVGEVSGRENRLVLMKDGDLKFSLDDVEATFVPIKGDWLELKCTMQFDQKNPTDISAAQVLFSHIVFIAIWYWWLGRLLVQCQLMTMTWYCNTYVKVFIVRYVIAAYYFTIRKIIIVYIINSYTWDLNPLKKKLFELLL